MSNTVREQLVKTPNGEWIQLSDYLRGGDIHKWRKSDEICTVRLYNTEVGKGHCLLAEVNNDLEAQTILDEWIEKVEKIRQQSVEMLEQTPSGSWILLSKIIELSLECISEEKTIVRVKNDSNEYTIIFNGSPKGAKDVARSFGEKINKARLLYCKDTQKIPLTDELMEDDEFLDNDEIEQRYHV